MSATFRVIVAGSRTFGDFALLVRKLDSLLAGKSLPVCIISGAARGADQLGEKYASMRGLDLVRMPAEWDRDGKSAGFKRNTRMAQTADALVAFWDGKSRGTKHMIAEAHKKNLNVRVIFYRKENA
jgi:hypothetical protein